MSSKLTWLQLRPKEPTTLAVDFSRYGGIGKFVEVLEGEKRVLKLNRMVEFLDHQFGNESSDSLNDLMHNVVKCEDRTFITLAGYAHLLLAERMVDQKYAKAEVNLEIDKAVAILDLANRGGDHPLLPRAARLKRRVNLKDYIGLVIAVVVVMILILVWGFFAGQIRLGKLDIF